MSKDSFNWKSLFFNNESEDKGGQRGNEHIPSNLPNNETRFPVESNISSSTGSANMLKNPYFEEILNVYEKGFNSLNLEDFDFFELYKSVVAVGVTNPQSYHMAFTMGKTIKSDLTKEYLLEKSVYYLTEIDKVYQKYNTIGNQKKSDLDTTITRDKVNLTKEISDLETQIAELQATLEKKKSELGRIDADNMGHYLEIQLKIEANEFAKKKITDSINLVVSGINQFL